MSALFPRRRQRPTAKPDYETSDVSPRLVLWVAFGLFAGMGLSILVVFGILRWIAPQASFSTATFSARQEQGGPRLEVSPSADRAALQREAQARLQGYGRIDKGAQTARIPIDRAMAILAARGWPDQDRGEGNKQ
jgi:hypothetical protein